MQNIYESLENKTYTAQDLFAVLLNFWIVFSIIGTYHRLANTILVTAFYSLPKIVVLIICVTCFLWSCVCFISKNKKLRSSGILVNTGFYLWIGLTLLIVSPFSIVTGTYLLIAVRYLILYLAIRVQEGH